MNKGLVDAIKNLCSQGGANTAVWKGDYFLKKLQKLTVEGAFAAMWVKGGRISSINGHRQLCCLQKLVRLLSHSPNYYSIRKRRHVGCMDKLLKLGF
jgi:hypothetical protein